MRIAVVSDIHGNLRAFEAVLNDIRVMAPDLVLHGGDLADAGSSPVELIDQIRELGWRGVMGNTDEMLVKPESLEKFAAASSAPPAIWEAMRRIAAATREKLGEDRLAWIRSLPYSEAVPGMALVHALPGNCWRTLAANSNDEDLQAAYAVLNEQVVTIGHTHVPNIRRMSGRPELLVNAGSVGLPYDGDPRASYLLLDEGIPSLRRIEYRVDDEIKELRRCGLPGAAWTISMLETSSPQLPGALGSP